MTAAIFFIFCLLLTDLISVPDRMPGSGQNSYTSITQTDTFNQSVLPLYYTENQLFSYRKKIL